MENKKMSFEEQMDELEKIVNQLEQGDVPLEQALDQFQKGMEISKKLQNTLDNAQKTLTHVIDNDENEELFEKEDLDEK
ncbi:exodeoxyribonuclease VII small subunit [Ligilactobacillus cholophilus]|uniref:exodeoxyribonuclease VII small subunit n=1 Tax=Ligilactobacillus cholophilus TaxID=3050131 RepID=UPI0025AFEB22|nr:exodeoxyribonuclease VII small subunit [Ligilactobacillus cholophilus]